MQVNVIEHIRDGDLTNKLEEVKKEGKREMIRNQRGMA